MSKSIPSFQSTESDTRVDPTRYPAVLGVDWSDKSHCICLISPKHTTDSEVRISEVAQDPDKLHAWANDLREQFSGQKVAVVVDQKQGPLISFLLDCNDLFDVYPVHPVSAKNFRQAIRPSGLKDDGNDALAHARFFISVPEAFHGPLRRDDPKAEAIDRLCWDRRQVVDSITRVHNELVANLKQYFPHGLKLLGARLDTLLACQFLDKWPDFEKLRAAKTQTIRKIFYAHHYRRIDKLEQRLKELKQQQPLSNHAPLVECAALKTKILIRQMRALVGARQEYDERIAEAFSKHAKAHIFKNVPGAGAALAPRLLAELAQSLPPERDGEASIVQKTTGIAPIRVQSGPSESIQMRRAAPNYRRQTFIEFARCSTLFCPWAKAYLQLKTENGKSYYSILRSLAFKWIRILYRCYHQNIAYDDEHYMKVLEKHNPLLHRRAVELNN